MIDLQWSFIEINHRLFPENAWGVDIIGLVLQQNDQHLTICPVHPHIQRSTEKDIIIAAEFNRFNIPLVVVIKKAHAFPYRVLGNKFPPEKVSQPIIDGLMTGLTKEDSQEGFVYTGEDYFHQGRLVFSKSLSSTKNASKEICGLDSVGWNKFARQLCKLLRTPFSTKNISDTDKQLCKAIVGSFPVSIEDVSNANTGNVPNEMIIQKTHPRGSVEPIIFVGTNTLANFGVKLFILPIWTKNLVKK